MTQSMAMLQLRVRLLMHEGGYVCTVASKQVPKANIMQVIGFILEHACYSSLVAKMLPSPCIAAHGYPEL